MGEAIERTLAECHAIHAEQKTQTIHLKENSIKEGFSTGFSQFFNQILHLLDNYEALQRERLSTMREQLQETLKNALYDPLIIERVAAHLQSHYKNETPLILYLPTGISPPIALSHLHCLVTEDNHITLQVGTQALRFPVDSLCQQWLNAVDTNDNISNRHVDNLIPSVLNEIIEKLLKYRQSHLLSII